MTQCLSWQPLSRSYCGTIISQFRTPTLFVFLSGRKVCTSQRNFLWSNVFRASPLAILFVLLVKERWRPTLQLALLGTCAARLIYDVAPLSRAMRVRCIQSARPPVPSPAAPWPAWGVVLACLRRSCLPHTVLLRHRERPRVWRRASRCSVIVGSAHSAVGGF